MCALRGRAKNGHVHFVLRGITFLGYCRIQYRVHRYRLAPTMRPHSPRQGHPGCFRRHGGPDDRCAGGTKRGVCATVSNARFTYTRPCDVGLLELCVGSRGLVLLLFCQRSSDIGYGRFSSFFKGGYSSTTSLSSCDPFRLGSTPPCRTFHT
jgi:hypothetical protein